MLKRELQRVGLCAAIGIVIGLLSSGPQYLVQFALYGIGLGYGFCFVLPALLGALKGFGNGSIMAIAFKNVFGVLILLVLCILAVGILISVAWLFGMGMAVYRLWQAWREDCAMGVRYHMPFRSGRHRGSRTRRQTPEDDWEDDWNRSDDDWEDDFWKP